MKLSLVLHNFSAESRVKNGCHGTVGNRSPRATSTKEDLFHGLVTSLMSLDTIMRTLSATLSIIRLLFRRLFLPQPLVAFAFSNGETVERRRDGRDRWRNRFVNERKPTETDPSFYRVYDFQRVRIGLPRTVARNWSR